MEDAVFRLLVVDDEKGICDILKRFLEGKGYEVDTAQSAEEALKMLPDNEYAAAIADLRMPGMDGLEFVEKIKSSGHKLEVIVMSGHGTVQTAVEAIKRGAFDFIEKPLSFEKLLVTVKNALQKNSMENRIDFLETRLRGDVEFSCLIGKNREFLKAVNLARQVSGSDVNLLITGESGTGKEVFANAVHHAGPRGKGPFMAINCAAIPENLLESELFGYEKGAFTGASAKRAGHFESANGGTIFLDEVGDLPMALQAKILRVVQEKTVTRLGSSASIPIDCRIISATNRILEDDVAAGTFREDLYYRLNVVELRIPSLRERASDVPLLAEHFLRKHGAEVMKLDKDVLSTFQHYNWPGNIRELENVIQRAIVLARGNIVTMELVPEKMLKPMETPVAGNEGRNIMIPLFCDYKEAQASFEKEYINGLLEKNQGNVLKCAEDMRITRQTLHRLLRKYDITSHTFRS